MPLRKLEILATSNWGQYSHNGNSSDVSWQIKYLNRKKKKPGNFGIWKNLLNFADWDYFNIVPVLILLYSIFLIYLGMILQQQKKLLKIFGVLFEIPLLIKQCPTLKKLSLEKRELNLQDLLILKRHI